MAQQALPPQPPGNDFSNPSWQRWFTLLLDRVTKASQLVWSQVDKSNSNLTDLATRNHSDLQSLQGGTAGQYYHMTAAEYNNFKADMLAFAAAHG